MTFAEYYARLGENIELDDEIELRPGASLDDLRVEWVSTDTELTRTGIREGELYYPALAVPLGEADEMVCPDWHVEHVREHQRHAPGGLNLLVIGYSGVDSEVRKLLAWGERRLSSLLVVNGSLKQSLAAAEALTRDLKAPVFESMAFAGGFNDFAQSNALSDYLRGLPDTGD